MTDKNKYNLINDMLENEFRAKVVMPLLSAMGYTKVRERNGTQEYGKDITYLDC